IIWVQLEPGNDLTSAAAGGTPPRLVRLENNDICSPLCQVQSGRKPGYPTADDTDLRCDLPFERCKDRVFPRRSLPQAIVHYIPPQKVPKARVRLSNGDGSAPRPA